MFGLSPDGVVHLVLVAIGAGWFVVQLFTNGKIGAVLLSLQKVEGKLDVHIEGVRVKHGAIDQHLEATDGRVDRLEGRVFLK